MSVIQFDADELQPVIDQAVEAAVRRLRAERSADEYGKILLTKRQAADVLGVSGSTLDRLRRDAGLPCVKLDGLVLFRPESLREWAAAREAQDTADDEENVENHTCTDRSNE